MESQGTRDRMFPGDKEASWGDVVQELRLVSEIMP